MKKKYIMGLRVGGLMEQPDYTIQQIKEVWAKDLKNAKAEWAKITNMDQEAVWCPRRQTFWGFNVVEIENE